MSQENHQNSELTQFSALLKRMREGDREAAGQAISLVYKELHNIAVRQMKHESPGHVLQATALIHEAYLRLMGNGAIDISSRRHFLAVASEQMRHILVDCARSANALKRGGGAITVGLDDVQIGAKEPSVDVLALDEAINELQRLDPRPAQVAVWMYFGGYTEKEVAAALEVSLKTVRKEWDFARSWLYDRLATVPVA